MREFVVVVAVMFAGCATTRDVDRESTGIQTMALGGGFVATGSVAVAGAAVGAGVAVALAETSPVVSVKDAVGSILPYVVAGVVGGGIQIMVGAVLLRNGRATYLGEDGAPTEAAVAAKEAPVVDERLEQAKGRMIEACLDAKCSSAECRSVKGVAARATPELDVWLDAEGCE